MQSSLLLGFLSGSPGMGELLLIFAVVLILFGPRRLPEFAKMIGRALEELRRTSQDFRDQVMRIDSPLEPSHTPDPSALQAEDVNGDLEDGAFDETFDAPEEWQDVGDETGHAPVEKVRDDGKEGGRVDELDQ